MIHYAGFTALNYIAGVSILIPLPFHIANRNLAVCCLFTTISLGCLLTAVNASIWHEVKNPVLLAYGYCDVAARYLDVMQIICLGCGLAILRYLAKILRSRGASATSHANRTRRALAELAIIYTLPVLALTLQGLFLNPIRYIITPTSGCQLLLPGTKLAVLYYLPSPILAVACAIYAALILQALYRKRKEFREVLHTSNSGLNSARFIRLLVLALGTLIFFLPVSIYVTYQELKLFVGPNAHPAPYNLKQLSPFFDNDKGKITILYGVAESIDFLYYIFPLSAFFFAGIFGIGREANKAYKRWLRAVGLGHVVDRIERATLPTLATRIPSKLLTFGKSISARSDASLKFSMHDSSSNDFEANQEVCFGESEKYRVMVFDRGHNQEVSSETKARVWSETSVPCSPHKIKIVSEAAQSSTESI